MLYRVRAPDGETYGKLAELLVDCSICLELPRHLVVAVRLMDDAHRDLVTRHNGTITTDYQYDLDVPTGAA